MPLPVQYADYALWQREVLGTGSIRTVCCRLSWLFGVQVLAGVPEELALPVDRPRPAVASHRGGWWCGWPAEVQERLVGWPGPGCDGFMVLQSALAVLLSRLGADGDSDRGPVAGAAMRRWTIWWGFSSTTLVLRVDLSGDPTFRRGVGPGAGRSLGA